MTFVINAHANCVTGLTPFYLIYGREPTIPLHTIVQLPQLEALEPQDFIRTRALAMARSLIYAKENYDTYYRRAVATYMARSPIGEPPHLDKLVWAWSPYRNLGTLEALSAKWSGLWKVVKFSPPALLVIQTTWLAITGRREVCTQKL